MTRPLTGLAVAVGLILAVRAWSAPPEVKGTSPFGVTRGESTEVTISGGNLAGNPELVAPFGFAIDPASARAGDAAAWKPKIAVAPETPIGVYPVRVKTDDGLSGPFLFSVGQLPQVAEEEGNNTFEAAQAIPSPVVVEGQAAGNDVDYFRFPGKKGQRIVIDAQCSRIGSGIDPTIRLTTAARAFVASADDSPGLLTDARLVVDLPGDGDYVIELSDSRYQGGDRPIYRLVVGPVPVAEEVYPLGGREGETVGFEFRGGTLPEMRVAAATLSPIPGGDQARPRVTDRALGLGGPTDPPLEVESMAPRAVGRLPELREPADPADPPTRAVAPVVLNGRIDPAGDEDRFVLSVAPGQKLRMRMVAADLDSALDGQLLVIGAKGTILATADDTNRPPIVVTKTTKKTDVIISPDPSLDYTVPAGLTEVTIVVKDLEGRGGSGFPYRLTVEPIVPSFEVQLDEAQVNVPRGGTAAVGVKVTRQGYNGPITLGLANPPSGLTVRPGTIAEGQTTGVLTLTAAADAAFGVANLQVEGRAQGPDGPIVRPARKPLAFAMQGVLPTNLVIQTGLPAAPSAPEPVVLATPEAPIEVAHGGEASIPIRVTRSEGADAALDLAAPVLPTGLTVAGGKVAEKAAEGTATVKAAAEAPLGASTIALTAKGKVGDKEGTFASPAVTVEVVRPAALELAAPAIEVKAGETLEVKGKVVRRGGFKDPVTVKLNGLPAGLKAEPVTVAPEASDFALTVVADPGAAAASANAQVALAFQLNKKDYPIPPSSLAVKVVPAPPADKDQEKAKAGDGPAK